MKHIDIRFRFICKAVEQGIITLLYCSTNKMVTVILTKALPHFKFVKLGDLLGLCLGGGGVLEWAMQQSLLWVWSVQQRVL